MVATTGAGAKECGPFDALRMGVDPSFFSSSEKSSRMTRGRGLERGAAMKEGWRDPCGVARTRSRDAGRRAM